MGLGASVGLENSSARGDYDDYLLKVARMIRHNEGDEACAQYLVWAESDHMRLGTRADARLRAEATVSAIRSDDQLWIDD
jgi:hypothetical protein